MEIKKGYKMTDVGVIPEDWEVKSIDNIGEFSKGSGISKSEAKSGTIKAIRYGELYTIHNYIIKKYESFISQEVANKSKKLTKGDIVFACSGETKEDIGKCAAFVDDCETYAGGDTIIFSPTIKTDSNYLGYILNSSSSMDQKSSSAQGDSVVHISVDSIRNIQIPLPDFSEQQAIADALTKVDNLITSLTKVIEKKKLIKKGAMQKLLSGEMRLDGFEGEFATKTFSDFIERFATGLNPRDNFELNKGGNNYYVTIKNFINGKLFLDDNCDKITDEAIDIIDKRSSLKVGDVLFSSIGRIGDAYVINETPTNWNINESVFSLRPNPTIMDSFFLYYLIKSDSVQKKFDDAISGSTLKSIKLNDLKEIECTYPQNIDEQTAIANILTTMDNEIEALEKERDKYKCIKQGMMQQLLTGKIRLTCQ